MQFGGIFNTKVFLGLLNERILLVYNWLDFGIEILQSVHSNKQCQLSQACN
jgi:hypothetical protein